jgi:DNA-binding HxlR family transcriptional regulator
MIMREATLGVTRFGDFREQLGVADNVLSDRLRQLVKAGVLVKVPYRDDRRTREEYRLTQAGAALEPVLRAMGEWADSHIAGPAGAASMRATHVGCGGTLDPGGRCAQCGDAVSRENRAWLRPWTSDEPLDLAVAWTT